VQRPPLKPLALSITFPCHNEEANVARVTLAALEVGRRIADELEVVIVDDASTDRTGALADELAAAHPEVRVVHNAVSRGYGAALTSGLRAATKPWVFYTDGDGQFDIGELPALLPLLADHDIVSCYRLRRVDGWVRRLNAWCWTRLVNALFDIRLRDIDCAFKIYPRSLFDTIELKSTGALIDTETLAKARNLGLRIAQRGVHHYPRTAGRPTGAQLKVIFRAFRELLALHRDIRRTGRAAGGRGRDGG